MKQPIIKLAVIALVMSLTACSTNTREQNTFLGAGSGAAVGGLATGLAGASPWGVVAGVVGGGLIGGLIGNNVDSTDYSHMSSAMNDNSMNQPANWTNSHTGAWYKVVPTSGVMAYHGYSTCRHYVAYGRYQGHTTKTRGIACRMRDGSWQHMR